jgi:hypothetical protein
MAFASFSSFGGSQMRSHKKTVRQQSIQTFGAVSSQSYTDANGTYTQYYFLSTSGTNYIQLNNITKTLTISILCIGGGGGGAIAGGGGGAGGFREYSLTLNPANFTSEKITCIVGAGGAGAQDTTNLRTVANSGGNTTVTFQNNTIHNLLSKGGGGGGGRDTKGSDGASGGGSMEQTSQTTGLSTATTGEYGNRGGYSYPRDWQSGSGGGGAGGVGSDSVGGSPTNTRGGPGGIGKRCSLNGISNTLYWAGGGGGMDQERNSYKGLNVGGKGGGGGGWSGPSNAANGNIWLSAGGGDAYMPASDGNAGANTGSGGGGMYYNGRTNGDTTVYRGGNGAAGIVIVSIQTGGTNISATKSVVEVGESFSVVCDSPFTGGTYTISGPSPANLGLDTLEPGTFTAGTILVLSYTLVNISAMTNMIFTFTLSTGTVYTTTVLLMPNISTTLYNPIESYRKGDTYGYSGTNSQLNDESNYAVLSGNLTFYMWFPNTIEYVTGFYIQQRSDGQRWTSCNFSYTTETVTSSNVMTKTYTSLGIFSPNYSTTYSGADYFLLSEHTFTTPIRASAVKFVAISWNTFPGFRVALKYMGNGLITQLIATSTVTLQDLSKLTDVSCNNVYTYKGGTGYSGEMNINETRGYISVGNGCLRSGNTKWMPRNLFSESPKLTIMCWVYLTGYQQYDTIAGFDNGSTIAGISFGFQGGILKLAKNTSRFTESQLEIFPILSLNTWTHICATMHLDGVNGNAVITYYINGASAGTFTDTVSWNGADTIPVDSTFYVGKYSYLGTNNNTTSRAMHRINYLRLFNRELSSAEVQAYYNTNT